MRTIVDYERKKTPGKELPTPQLVHIEMVFLNRANRADASGKACGTWQERWYVRFGKAQPRRYDVGFKADGARGTWIGIMARNDPNAAWFNHG